MDITVDQLLAKIGYLTVLLDGANQQIAALEAALTEERREREQGEAAD